MIIRSVNTNKKVFFNPFDGPKIEKVIPLTQAQAEVWIACEIGGEDANRAYNESISIILKGSLNIPALKDAKEKLINRHEALRSLFSPNGRFMTIVEDISTGIISKDISTLNSKEQDDELKSFLATEAHYVFDLVKGPLVKFTLVKLSEKEHQLIITAHHIICDGWSFGIILEELGIFYSAYISGNTPVIPKAETFSSYVDDELEFLNSKAFQVTEKYWLDQYKDSIPTVSLPIDFSRPNLRTYTSDRLDFILESSTVESLRKVGIKSGASLVVTLMSAFEVFLYHQTGNNDLVLGLAAAGQPFNDRTQLVGHCANILPLHSQIDPNHAFSEFLKLRKTSFFEAYEHQRFSFGQLLQKLAISRDPSRVPLVPVLFNIDYGMGSEVSFDGLEFVLKSNPRAFEAFELFLNATESENNFILEWSYNTSLFKSERIKQMMVVLEGIIKRVVENPEIKIADLVKIDESPYKKLNDTFVSYPKLSLTDLISEQAKITPKNQALKYLDSEMSYEVMQLKANQLAHQLSQAGISPNDFVGVCVPRSNELMVSLLAIMQCGATYVPLDTTYPSARLNYMLENTGAKFLISTDALSAKLEFDGTLLMMDDLFSNLDSFPSVPTLIDIHPDTIAYTLYTSGSTGKPKGVMVTHKNLVNFLCSVKEKPGIIESDRLLCITNVSFDMAVLDLYLPLISGATLVLAHEDISKDGHLLLELLKEEGITMIQATPTSWQMLLDSGWKTPLPLRAICGAEPWSLSLAQDLLPRVSELWNMYGPTETTVWSMRKQISQNDQLISIGRPIANTQIYLLNEHNMLVRPGEIGEIVIGGDGVSKGYWKRPDLMIDKFIDNPFNTENKSQLYRTGDLGKLLPNGELQCLGRIDHQVKIRGHRIELGEIEQVLNALDEVQSSIVLVNNDILLAFVITTDVDSEKSDIISSFKQVLKDELPSYMVPQLFHLVNEFPTTLNGKIDRQALINNSILQAQTLDYTEPRNETERVIHKIWCECLNKEKVDIFNDFFELGGHSLIAVRVVNLLHKEISEKLPLSALMIYPTIEKLAAFIDRDKAIKEENWSSLVPIRPKGNKTPLYVVHGAGHNILFFNSTAKSLNANQPVYGLQSKGLKDGDEPFDKIEDMAKHYISEILRSNPNGPYALCGYSFGGVIAYEMARQLRTQGKIVTILMLIDTYVFPKYYFSNTFVKKVSSVYYVLGKICFAINKIFVSKAVFNARLKSVKNLMRRLVVRGNHQVNETNESLNIFNASLSELDRTQDFALDTYTITPQDIEIDLFVAQDNVYFKHDKKYYGWKNIALGGINKHAIPGNHGTMFSPPFDKELAKILQNVLDKKNG